MKAIPEHGMSTLFIPGFRLYYQYEHPTVLKNYLAEDQCVVATANVQHAGARIIFLEIAKAQ